MFDIDLQSRVPIYEQLYKKTVELIIKGILKEDTQMPSVRNLAKQLGVNPNTVAKAYQELDRNGVTYSLTGRGSFVAKVDKQQLKDFALLDFDLSVDEALQAGLSRKDLVQRINERQEE